VATASRALNGQPDVRPETRERVLRAAEEIAFRPTNGRAGSTDFTIAILTSDSVGRFSIPIMLGAEDALGAGRAAILLCDARGDAIREQHYLQVLVERRVDGVIVVGERTDARPPVAPALPIPVVYAYAPSTDPADASFVPDQTRGAAAAVEHLLSLGRRRIAHIAGPLDFGATVDRVTGMRDALSAAGVAAVGEPLYGGDWSQRWGRHAAAALLSRTPDIDAVFCGNDQIAVGVMDTLRESGRRVPEDVSVVGFDNWDLVAADARPPLTTIDMDLEELGRAAARHLIERIGGQTSGGVQLRPCRLVIRESTAPVLRQVVPE